MASLSISRSQIFFLLVLLMGGQDLPRILGLIGFGIILKSSDHTHRQASNLMPLSRLLGCIPRKKGYDPKFSSPNHMLDLCNTHLYLNCIIARKSWVAGSLRHTRSYILPATKI